MPRSALYGRFLMCGRYFLKMLAAWNEYAQIRDSGWPEDFSSYNIAPSQDVPALRMIDGLCHGSMLRWGLIPFFARGAPPKFSTINARVEHIESGPVWRGPWKRGQRCILPASGFFEWHLTAGGSKQPFAIEVADQPVFGLAGLWDRSKRPDGTAVESCAIITLPASKLMATIHNSGKRMPAILPIEARDTWLAGSPMAAKSVLTQYPDELLHAYRVSTRVNAPKNNDADLVSPVT